MIYIDPPYNSGRDFIYDDNYSETDADYRARSDQADQHGQRLVANTEANGRFHSELAVYDPPAAQIGAKPAARRRRAVHLHRRQRGRQIDNIKPDRSPEDLLFQVLLDWGVDLTLPITRETLAGKQVLFVDCDALAACFDTGIDETLVREIAARQPLRVVFRDAGFQDDSMKINVEQLFKTLSPGTEVRSI